MDDQVRTGGDAVSKRAVRGRWTAEQRSEIVKASMVAGASINEVAEQYGIRANLLTAWRRRDARTTTVQRKNPSTRFAAVKIKAEPPEGTIEIDQARSLVRVHGIVDARMLREVLAALR